jgi:hypothetical protein
LQREEKEERVVGSYADLSLYNPTEEYDDTTEVYVEENVIGNKQRQKYLKGLCLIRDQMVERVKELGLERPPNSLLKK